MIFSVYVRMNNIITQIIVYQVRPNFRRFVPLCFRVAKIWPGDEAKPRPALALSAGVA